MSSSNPALLACALSFLNRVGAFALLTAACAADRLGAAPHDEQNRAAVAGTAGGVSDHRGTSGTSPLQTASAGAGSPALLGAKAGSSAGTRAADAGLGSPAPNTGHGGAATEAGSTAPPRTSSVAGSSSSGAVGTAGAAGSAPAVGTPTFLLGADITDQESASEATRARLLETMKLHGFNAIRLRTFVDPKARDGYDKAQGYADLAHTIAFGKQVKDAGMQLLIDFHYSDNWADPGKQCVPVAWQSHGAIEQLAAALHDYTRDAVTQLVAGGARPDMIQLGNEITPGMLIHRCDDNGQPIGQNSVTGSTSNWKNLGLLLQSGATAVREVDPTISLALHIDRGGDKASEPAGTALQASSAWLTNSAKYVQVDAFGLSCYQRYQGDPNDAARTKAGWNATFSGLAANFPTLQLFAAEYGPMQREINDVVYGLANRQGIGTFNWEPTTRGDWNTGHDLLRRSGDDYLPQPDLQLYDQMQTDYAARL